MTTDAIVLGLGAMGSAAVYHLARRGHRVLGLDAYERGHHRGSSHGQSRIIRQAYHESPDYIPLIKRAYALWRELESASGQALLHVNGGLIIGLPDGRTVQGTLTSARMHDLPYEILSPAQVAERFPGFRLTGDLVAVLEPSAGYLAAERCLDAHLDLAIRHSAELHFNEAVRSWSIDGSGVRVETGRNVYRADRLVIAAGPWASSVMSELKLPLYVKRIVNAYFAPKSPDLYDPADCPILSLLVPEGHYYGVPGSPELGWKIGRGDTDDRCTPETIDRVVTDAEVSDFRQVLDCYLPYAAGELRSTATCMYTMTPDKHFIVDRHPEYAQVAIACGFSGHGFKFSNVIGEVLADLALTGRTEHDVRFLSASRFA